MAAAAATFKDGDDVYIFPRDLHVVHGENPKYWEWHWLLLESLDYKEAEVVKLKEVWWLEVSGKYDMSNLQKGENYVVEFVIMITDPRGGWANGPATVTLHVPGTTTTDDNVKLNELPPNKWSSITSGEFTASASGEVSFKLALTNTDVRKTGLIVKNAVIRRKYWT